jgi:hypothetical protein
LEIDRSTIHKCDSTTLAENNRRFAFVAHLGFGELRADFEHVVVTLALAVVNLESRVLPLFQYCCQEFEFQRRYKMSFADHTT